MNLSEEVIKDILLTFFGIIQLLGVAAIGVGITMWSDTRSLKKAMNSAFTKIRELEAKVCHKSDDK